MGTLCPHGRPIALGTLQNGENELFRAFPAFPAFLKIQAALAYPLDRNGQKAGKWPEWLLYGFSSFRDPLVPWIQTAESGLEALLLQA